MPGLLGLASKTPPEWAATALRDETALLRDHAHLERKAAGHVLTLLGQVPWATDRLLATAAEELEHCERVCKLLTKRGEELGPDPGNPYVQALAKLGKGRLLDRILRMGIIEARSYEKFCLLGAAVDGELADLWNGLKNSEAGHHAMFSQIAYERWPRDEVRARWDALAQAEAEICAGLPWGSRIH